MSTLAMFGYKKAGNLVYACSGKLSSVLRIDNGDFHVNSLVFTFLLISPYLHDISDIMIHQIRAEILGCYRMVSLV